jgi:hypothetical protein
VKIPSKIDLVIYGLLAIGVVTLFLVVKKWHDDSVYELPKAIVKAERIQSEWDKAKESDALTEVRTDEFTRAVVAISNPERKLSDRVCKRTSLPAVSEGADPSQLAAPEREPGVSGEDSFWDVSVGTTVYGKRCEILAAEALTWRLWYKDQYELSRKED